MTDTTQPTTNQGRRKLYPLSVREAATANLLEIVNDPDFSWEEPAEAPDDDDASAILSWAFWGLLIALPFVSLYLLGLFAGGPR